MRLVFLLALLVLPLSACKTTVQDGDKRVTYEDRDRYDGGYKHCPPGHAKKGWC